MLRWQPRIPLDTIHGLPVWKPETLLSYMGARPARFPWTDIAEWLWEPCENVDTHLVAAELEGHPPAAWARTAYLLERGERPDAAADLAASGPAIGDGPHYFGRRVDADEYKPWMPVWSPKYKVVDYLLERKLVLRLETCETNEVRVLAGQVWDDVAVVPTMRVGENVAEPRPSATP